MSDTPRLPPGRPRTTALAVVGFGLAYFALSHLGLSFIDPAAHVALLWPASGLALAVLILSPRSRWPWLALALATANLGAELTARPSSLIALGLVAANTLEALLAAWAFQRVAGRATPTGTARDLRGLLAATVGANALTAGVGGAVVAASFGVSLGHAWFTWWLADGLGMATLAPFFVAAARPRRVRPVDAGATAGALAALAGTAALAAGIWWHAPGTGFPVLGFPYLIFPALLFASMVFGPAVASGALAIVSVIAALATVHGLGPFARPELSGAAQVLALQGFLVAALLSSLAVAAAVSSRRRAERRAHLEADRFASVLRAATESSVIATDADGTITVFNEGAERMLGHRAQAVVGRTSPAIFHDPAEVVARAAELGLEPGFDVFVNAARAGRPETRDWTYIRADGQRLTVSLTVTAMHGSDGSATGFIGIARDITAQRQAEHELALSEERHRLLLANLPDAMIWLFDRDLRCVAIQGQMVSRVGIDPAAFVGRPLAETLPPEQAAVLAPLYEAALEGTPGRIDWTSARSELEYDLEVEPYRLPSGEIDGVFVLTRDVTERRRQEEAVRRAEADLRTVFEAAPIGNLVLDGDLRVTSVNAAAAAIAGCEIAELEGRPAATFVHPEDAERLLGLVTDLDQAPATSVHADVRVLHTAGHPVVCSMHATRLGAGPASPRVLLQIIDATERKRFEGQLRHMADHDPLTGLLNRRRFEQELERQVARVARYGPVGALIVLDVDNFKQVNDTLGHNAGDQLIVSVGQVLRERLRETDTLARLGGDEFAIILPAADQAGAELVAASIVEKIRENVVEFNGAKRRTVTASVGISMFEATEGLTGESMLIDADLAMYDAKEAGRDRYSFFATEEYGQARTKVRMTWMERIGEAIEHDRFSLLAQPIVDLHSGAVSQHELLLRMDGEDGDAIPPATFIYIAERYGLMPAIDRWVAHQAVELLAARERAGNPLRLEVNVSGKSMGDPDLLASIQDDLRRTGIDARNLIFEVTETAAVADIAVARRFAEQLSDLGCRFALDDFGAGFGSFYYLKHLPFDYLKIDGEFVANCVRNRNDQLIIASLVQIAHGMGKETIAEFVGDEDTRRLLARAGVDYGQGYHLGRPAPLLDALGVPLPAQAEKDRRAGYSSTKRLRTGA